MNENERLSEKVSELDAKVTESNKRMQDMKTQQTANLKRVQENARNNVANKVKPLRRELVVKEAHIQKLNAELSQRQKELQQVREEVSKRLSCLVSRFVFSTCCPLVRQPPGKPGRRTDDNGQFRSELTKQRQITKRMRLNVISSLEKCREWKERATQLDNDKQELQTMVCCSFCIFFFSGHFG